MKNFCKKTVLVKEEFKETSELFGPIGHPRDAWDESRCPLAFSRCLTCCMMWFISDFTTICNRLKLSFADVV